MEIQNQISQLLEEAKNNRELKRERAIGFFIGVFLMSGICLCSFSGFLYWIYQVGSNIP